MNTVSAKISGNNVRSTDYFLWQLSWYTVKVSPHTIAYAIEFYGPKRIIGLRLLVSNVGLLGCERRLTLGRSVHWVYCVAAIHLPDLRQVECGFQLFFVAFHGQLDQPVYQLFVRNPRCAP